MSEPQIYADLGIALILGLVLSLYDNKPRIGRGCLKNLVLLILRHWESKLSCPLWVWRVGRPAFPVGERLVPGASKVFETASSLSGVFSDMTAQWKVLKEFPGKRVRATGVRRFR